MREQVTEASVDCCDSIGRSDEGLVDHRHESSHRVCAFQKLVEACKRKNLDAIKSVIEERPELINQHDKRQRSLLHYAAVLLLEAPTNSQMGAKSIECFNYLTTLCEPKLWRLQDLDGLSILHLAVISSNVPLVRHIVFDNSHSHEQPLVCTLDNESHSPLHWAVITNSLESVKILIEFAGPKLAEQADLNGATPLHYATQTRDYPKYRHQLRLMLKRTTESLSPSCTFAETTSISNEGSNGTTSLSRSTTLSEASVNQQRGLEILEYLTALPQIDLECKDKDHRTPLLWAASSGNRDAILLLVSRGAKLASCDLNKLGALHCAASHGFTDCLDSLLNLAKNGSGSIDVNEPDSLSCTPLFYAVLSGNIDCVETLLERGANLNWQDGKGRTPAHFAALKGQLNSLKLLQARRANLWLANKQGDLPLHYAIKSGRLQVAKWLLEHSPFEHSVNAINNFGRSPIHLAVMKNNLEMAEYLVSCGANLNQLVKVRDKGRPPANEELNTLVNGSTFHQGRGGALYRYETALDMAARLNHLDCLQLLAKSQAQTASQVIRNRMSSGAPNAAVGRGLANPRSLFDLQTADKSSPIGFETSCSSASPAAESLARGAHKEQSQECSESQASGKMPELPRPAPSALPNSDDSMESSALSQSSLTSLRGLAAAKQPILSPLGEERVAQAEPRRGKKSMGGARAAGEYEDAANDAAADDAANEETNRKPYRGGIAYNNEHVSASIKYKLYGDSSNKTSVNQSSFPPLHRSASSQKNGRSSQSAPTRQRGQEIVTNVNVYTSPCPHCIQHDEEKCLLCSRHRQVKVGRNRPSYSDDSSSETSSSSSEESVQSGHHLPSLAEARQTTAPEEGEPPMNGDRSVGQIGGHLRSHLPPSQNFAQHLPVIMSDQELSNSPTSTEQRDASPGGGGANLHGTVSSPAEQEPRFDRSDRARNIHKLDRYRDQVRSPVAEYIRGQGTYQQPEQRSVSLSRASEASNRVKRTNYSQTRAKVSSHRLPEPSDDVIRSKSVSSLSGAGAGATPRSVSRQTVSRRLDQEDEDQELTTRVEKAIRKYRQEKRLFEELQNLKRSQIRSGRANEAVLVKRLVDHFRHDESPEAVGLEQYHGAYSYKSYERFLYDQLRRLSQSNCAKLRRRLSSSMHDYLEEELEAEWELRRVMDGCADDGCLVDQSVSESEADTPEVGGERRPEAGAEKRSEVSPIDRELVHALDQTGEVAQTATDIVSETQPTPEVALELEPEIQVEGESRRGSVSSVNSSRRSSVEVERERLISLPLKTSEAGLADELSSSIIVDALGNVSRAGSAKRSRQPVAEEELEEVRPEEEEVLESAPPEPMSRAGRRRSVVNIGNKLEVIYHDVAIEIDGVDSGTSKSETSSNGQREDEGGEKSDGEDTFDQEATVIESHKQQQSGDVTEKELDSQSTLSSPSLNTSAGSAGRRGSSPPGYMTAIQSADEKGPHLSAARRTSLVEPSPQTPKKVFSGYDLDEMRARRSPRRESRSSGRETEASIGGESAFGGDGKSESSSNELTATSQVEEVSRSRAVVSPTTRRRLARSKLLKGRYRPRVAMEQIRRRWRRIKAEERRRLRQMGGAREVEFVFSNSLGSEASKLAKSQPSLERQVAAFEDQAHYTLIYELNKDAQNRPAAGKGRLVGQWCHKKALRVVDVRTLKRTLSLPESLIYSNNLLRRFDILKL